MMMMAHCVWLSGCIFQKAHVQTSQNFLQTLRMFSYNGAHTKQITKSSLQQHWHDFDGNGLAKQVSNISARGAVLSLIRLCMLKAKSANESRD